MTRRLILDDMALIEAPEQPAISPDGARIAYVLRRCDVEFDRDVRALWLVGTDGSKPRPLTSGLDDSAPCWSPDGEHVAFLRSTDGPPQIWSLPLSGGEPTQLTHLALGAGAPRWSPDGSRIAFSSPVDLAARAGETDAARERRAVAPIAVRRLDYHTDGVGLARTMRQQVHVLDLSSGETTRVSGIDTNAGDPAWSPDSRRLAFTADSPDTDADLTMRRPAYVVDVAAAAGPKPQCVGFTAGSAGPLMWASDGSALLIVGNPTSPLGHNGLWRVTLDGTARPVDLTAAFDRNLMPGAPAYPGAAPQLVDDGKAVLCCLRDNGYTHLYAVPAHPDEGTVPRLVIGGNRRQIQGMSAAIDGRAAVVLATPTSFGEVATVDPTDGTLRVLTDHGQPLADVDLLVREERQFPISDGTIVHGWVLRRPDATGAQPLLLDIHGGPHNAWHGCADDVHLYHQVLAADGWTVLVLNPRGSDGYGEHLFTATVGSWGEADQLDFLEPLDTLVDEGVADPNRLAVTGYSYGGFMTCYLTGHDNRFAAAVAGGLISDLNSMVGTSDLGHFISEYELGGQPWTGRVPFDGLSPITRVSGVSTPTLVLHGTADLRCPVGQAELWFTALRERGVPTELVLYPDAAHLFPIVGRPSHRMDYNRRVVEWVSRYAGRDRSPWPLDEDHWQRRLSRLAEQHHVPGAALGVLRMRPDGGSDLVTAAHGVTNVDTGVPATVDTLFQIGSITKVWTTTLVMQLVDEGLIALDTPVIDVLPELRLADPIATKQVTMRHLLTHTSGIDGDVFTDTGRGDDCVEQFVDLLATVPMNHEPGATFSYCNAGFVVAARVIEKLSGQSWDEALRTRLLTPLGLHHTVTLPEDALLHRTAVGHSSGADPVRVSHWMLPRSAGPAGVITSSVADVLAFARMHLNGGVAADGKRLLSEAAATAMATFQVAVPDRRGIGDSWGLGWIRMTWDGHQLVGHDGSTIGQTAYLRILPEAGLAVTLLTNGGNGRELYEDLFREIFSELADVALPPRLTPPTDQPAVEPRSHVGTYERSGIRIEVGIDGEDGPMLRTTITGPLADLLSETTEEFVMRAVTEDVYLLGDATTGTWLPATFYRLPTGERYLHLGLRATPKVV